MNTADEEARKCLEQLMPTVLATLTSHSIPFHLISLRAMADVHGRRCSPVSSTVSHPIPSHLMAAVQVFTTLISLLGVLVVR